MAAYAHNDLDVTVQMTAADAPSPNVVSADHEDVGQESWKAFTHTTDDGGWQTTYGYIGNFASVTFDLGDGNASIVVGYTITCRGDAERAWTLYGSNNNIDWSSLDSRSLIAFDNNEMKTYNFSNTTAYRYYKLTLRSYDSTSGVVELELLGEPTWDINANLTVTPVLSGAIETDGLEMNGTLVIPVNISGTMGSIQNVISGTLTIPISIAGTVYSYPVYDGLLYANLPSMELDATGYGDLIGVGYPELPFFTLSAEAYGDPIATFDKSLPMFRLGTVAEELPVGIANLTLPMLRISTVADSGNLATFSASLPIFRLSTTGYLDVLATGDMTIPFFGISAFISPSTYTSLAMNLLNRGLTEFANYNFNSMCHFNGKNLGATTTGIHDLDSGTNDNGTKIDWNFTIGYIDLQIKTKKKLREMWMGCQIDGNVVVTVKKADGTEYEYKGESFEETERGVRVKFGKGIKTRYLSLDVKNEDVSTMELDAIRLMLDKYEGRR
jgi:hypothetical protein